MAPNRNGRRRLASVACSVGTATSAGTEGEPRRLSPMAMLAPSSSADMSSRRAQSPMRVLMPMPQCMPMKQSRPMSMEPMISVPFSTWQAEICVSRPMLLRSPIDTRSKAEQIGVLISTSRPTLAPMAR